MNGADRRGQRYGLRSGVPRLQPRQTALGSGKEHAATHTLNMLEHFAAVKTATLKRHSALADYPFAASIVEHHFLDGSLQARVTPPIAFYAFARLGLPSAQQPAVVHTETDLTMLIGHPGEAIGQRIDVAGREGEAQLLLNQLAEVNKTAAMRIEHIDAAVVGDAPKMAL